jgi:hypothetical protein
MPRAMNSKKPSRFRGKKSNFSQNSSSSQGSNYKAPYVATAQFRKPIICKIPKGIQLFPDRLQCHSTTVVDLGLSGSTASQHSYHLNSPAKLFGPQVNWTGAFADNVPAGMYYLLSSNTNAGSIAPYFHCITTDIDVLYEFTNIQNSVTAWATVVPSLQASLNGMTQTQLAENNAVQIQLPATGSAMMPLQIAGKYSVAKISNVPMSEILGNQNYRQTAGNLTPIPIYLHMIVASSDGITNCSVQTRATFTFKHLFVNKNNFVTTVPT